MALVTAFGALLAVVFDPIFGLPIAGAALAGLVFGRRPGLSLLVGLVTGVGAGLLDVALRQLLGGDKPATAEGLAIVTIAAASLLMAGPLTASLMKRLPAVGTTTVVAAALAGLNVAELWIYAQQVGQSVGGYSRQMFGEVAAQVGLAEEMVEAAVRLWPGAVVVESGLIAVVVVTAVGLIGSRVGVPLRRYPPLADFDLDARMALLPITALALLAAAGFMAQHSAWLEAVGVNVLVVARFVFFVQGAAVFAGLYRRANVSPMMRGFGFVLLGVTELFAPVVSLTGLADLWINIRRLPRDGNVGETKAPSGVD